MCVCMRVTCVVHARARHVLIYQNKKNKRIIIFFLWLCVCVKGVIKTCILGKTYKSLEQKKK